MRRSGRGSTSDRSRNARIRGVFTKLVKDGVVIMENKHQAKRFLEGMKSFESKAELLSKLTDSRDHGLRRIRDLLSFVNSTCDTEELLIPLLKEIINSETSRPIVVPLRNKVLMAIFSVPLFLETLAQRGEVASVAHEAAESLCSFLLCIANSFVEARKSESVKQLAEALRDRGDVSDSGILCRVLSLDANERNEEQLVRPGPRTLKVACWINDMRPPGGRHDNDHFNFRDITVVPTTGELRCKTEAWLPLFNGENAFVTDPVNRLLDRNFRLLREDAILTMKRNIDEQVKPWRNARIIGLHLAKIFSQEPVSFLVQVDTAVGGNPNWERSRALMQGSLVALCHEGVPAMLGVITVRDFDTPGEWLQASCGPILGVEMYSGDFKKAMEDLKVNVLIGVNKKRKGAGSITKATLTPGGRNSSYDLSVKYDLLEVSSSFFSYRPILESLQAMTNLPFIEELSGSTPVPSVRRPEYMPSVLSLPKASLKSFQLDLNSFASDVVVRGTSLDRTQAEALYHTFTNRVALIQGPPGTGKTFIGSLVAQMILENTKESILCVCYTNHALDQFLEHMYDRGERKIVRIGGRSKSEKLAPYNLRELSHRNGMLRGQNEIDRWMKRVVAQLHKQREIFKEELTEMETPVEWTSPDGGIRRFLQEEYPDILKCFELHDPGDGFHIVGRDSKELKDEYLFERWINGDVFPDWLEPYLPADIPPKFTELWTKPLHERVVTLGEWKHEILRPCVSGIEDSMFQLNDLSKERKSIQHQLDLEILKDARIIGATTTGAAQYKELLCSKGTGVVIVEEAGEVLEAHVLSILDAKSTKHLILIGDHQQLRPKVESYVLSTVSGGGYDLDCSLFERLVLSGLPSVTLGVQHRMRPEIAEFIRKQTYPALRDHESVKSFPNVKGVTDNVLFIDHSVPEGGSSDEDTCTTKTKFNHFEAEMSIEIVRFLLLQGYNPNRIVVLTPYLGQLLLIIKQVRLRLKEATAFVSEKDQRDISTLDEELFLEPHDKEQKEVRCSSIDNYQGEEADIVVISLVRSNSIGKIGFLKEPQRVNVLLSRARHGLFLIGNSNTLLHGGGPVWKPIIDEFRSRSQLVRGLPTYCQLHPSDSMELLTNVEDFRTARPNGGCTRPCSFRMECGHACPLTCHSFDRNHQIVQRECNASCMRVPPDCPLGHRCRKLCKDLCGNCSEHVGPVNLNCGHILASTYCHYARNEEAISLLSSKCLEKVLHEFERSKHEVQTTCGNAKSDAPRCPALCSARIDSCGHQCSKTCSACDGNHLCGRSCERMLFCGHLCGQNCHGDSICPPCQSVCRMKCIHSKCSKRCHFVCASCVEPCDWICEHEGSCPLVCGAPCFRFPCNERCSNLLECGHRCPSLCGENCPDKRYCHVCGESSLKDKIVDMINLTTYADHDVDNDPIIVLPCLHVYSTSTLDGHFCITGVYEKSVEGKFSRIIPVNESDVNEKPKTCPDCRSAVHSVRRYGRLLQLTGLRSLERKHLMSTGEALRVVEERSQATGKSRLVGTKLIERLERIERKVEQSPMRRVFEACRNPDMFDVPRPPTQPLLHTLALLGNAYADLASQQGDEHDNLANATFDRAIHFADSNISTTSGCRLRLAKCKVLLKWQPVKDASKAHALELLEWVTVRRSINPELAEQADEIILNLNERHVIATVMSAMNVREGYNYGTSWNSHWYECENGHPYFIGECGGAMERSRCIECGATVGGSSHTLHSNNRRIGGVFSEILRQRPGI